MLKVCYTAAFSIFENSHSGGSPFSEYIHSRLPMNGRSECLKEWKDFLMQLKCSLWSSLHVELIRRMFSRTWPIAASSQSAQRSPIKSPRSHLNQPRLLCRKQDYYTTIRWDSRTQDMNTLSMLREEEEGAIGVRALWRNSQWCEAHGCLNEARWVVSRQSLVEHRLAEHDKFKWSKESEARMLWSAYWIAWHFEKAHLR